MKKIKAFVIAGDYREYLYHIKKLELSKSEYPYLSEDNWRGIHGVGLIKVGNYFRHPCADNINYIKTYLNQYSE